MKLLKAGTAIALAGAVIGVGGCVEFDGEVEGKQISKKEVRIKFALCDDTQPECNPEPEAPARRGETQTVETRVLLGFRVPKGTDMPEKFTPKDHPDIKFSKSASYTAEMNDRAPRKDSETWRGYISEDVATGLPSRGRFSLVFGLPKNPGKVFKYRPVAGYVDGAGPTDVVTCGENVRDTYSDGDTTYVCVDDPETATELQKSLKIELD